MGLIRLLVFGAVVAIIYFLIKRWLDKPTAKKQKIAHHGEMVRCAHCGTFLPEPDAVRADGKTYCSQAHRKADKHS